MGNEIFLKKRKDRLCATILGYKESEIDRYIPEDVAKDFREMLLDEINYFYNTVMDYLNNDINDEFLKMFKQLNDIHEAIMEE